VITLRAPAKVNLTLRVLGREQSGFHGLETLFCAISLADEVRVARRDDGEIELVVEGHVPTGLPEDNLAVRAARGYAREIGDQGGFAIHLSKKIPSAAGLGGGSSDAAATLLALQALCDFPLDARRLLRLGAELGSDVPFFLCGSPLAWAWSRGERLMALPPLDPRPILVAHPGTPMPTPRAFRMLAESRGTGFAPGAAVLDSSALHDWDALSDLATNDFGQIVAGEIPAVGEAVRAIRRAGARIAMVAGSGSAVFGVFDTPQARDAAVPSIARLGFATWRAETLAAMPIPRPDPT
jgi:4-diphosphocytidyl-2-C-methyl-D-erythritol kinase